MMNTAFLLDLGLLNQNVSIKSLCSLRVGGHADCVFYPSSQVHLKTAIRLLKKQGIPYKIWGNGTNILPSDQPYAGVIIRLNRLNQMTFNQETCVLEAGASLIACAYFAAYKNLSGLEFAYGIPATIGGATVMNAGAYQSNMFSIIESVLLLKNDEFVWVSAADLKPVYRHTLLKDHPEWVVLAVKMKLHTKERSAIFALMEDRKHRRIMSQALDYPSAGSVFQNPNSHQAWALIEQAGLRSHRIGGAKVSDKHSNFIINDRKAKAEDIKTLIELIQSTVYEKTSVSLKTEIELFNW